MRWVWVAVAVLLFAAFVLWAYRDYRGAKLVVDNPRDVAVTVTVDGSRPVEVPPRRSTVLRPAPGTHRLTMRATGVTLDNREVAVAAAELTFAPGKRYVYNGGAPARYATVELHVMRPSRAHLLLGEAFFAIPDGEHELETTVDAEAKKTGVTYLCHVAPGPSFGCPGVPADTHFADQPP